VTTPLTLFLEVFKLQGKDASKSAGNLFQFMTVLFTKEYLSSRRKYNTQLDPKDVDRASHDCAIVGFGIIGVWPLCYSATHIDISKREAYYKIYSRHFLSIRLIQPEYAD
jgi:hypothetical protein